MTAGPSVLPLRTRPDPFPGIDPSVGSVAHGPLSGVWPGASAHPLLIPLARSADCLPVAIDCFGPLDLARANRLQPRADAEHIRSHTRVALMISASAGMGVTVIDPDALIGQSYRVPALNSRPTPIAVRGGSGATRDSENGSSLHSLT